MDNERLKRIEEKIDRMEQKLDIVVRVETSISYLKWVVGAAWIAIGGSLFSK